jgi:hypothetical protein
MFIGMCYIILFEKIATSINNGLDTAPEALAGE